MITFVESWPKFVPEQKDRFTHLSDEKLGSILLDERFDPRSQIFYRYAEFQERDKPIDVYTAYLLLESGRFYI
jgi:hypothetical protein